MTFAFGSFTLGAALLVSAFKNIPLVDLIFGMKGTSIAAQGESHPSAGGSGGTSAPSTTSGGDPALKGTVIMDGHPVAKWIAAELKRARASGMWTGSVTSGYRSPADQARVCAETNGPCAEPGKSRHQGKAYPNGAVDVSDAPGLNQWCRKHHSKLEWAGPVDSVHFSHHYGGSY